MASEAPARTLEARAQPGARPTSEQRGSLDRALSLGKAGVAAAATVTARVVGFGALGLLLGVVAFFVELGTGLLAHPWGPWRYLVYSLLFVYAGVGAFGFGTAGLWRGIGRVAMNLVEKHKLAQHVLERVFSRAAVLSAGADTPEALRRPLPIEAIRETLRQAIAGYDTSDDFEGGARGFSRTILRRIKGWLCRKLEERLIALVGEETRDTSIAELSLARLRERAEQDLQEWMLDVLDGARNRQARIWATFFVLVVALTPIFLVQLR
ncbi:hypothetical protein [Archangium sp.]|uniref:hypothetical protein n=1 Tax=Archangium sp. TaxID=1872627 RepID=UPI00286AFE34|nr:hypothetical protein [Archangium sp.]